MTVPIFHAERLSGGETVSIASNPVVTIMPDFASKKWCRFGSPEVKSITGPRIRSVKCSPVLSNGPFVVQCAFFFLNGLDHFAHKGFKSFAFTVFDLAFDCPNNVLVHCFISHVHLVKNPSSTFLPMTRPLSCCTWAFLRVSTLTFPRLFVTVEIRVPSSMSSDTRFSNSCCFSMSSV